MNKLKARQLDFVAVACGVGRHLDGGDYSGDLARRVSKGLSGHYNARIMMAGCLAVRTGCRAKS